MDKTVVTGLPPGFEMVPARPAAPAQPAPPPGFELVPQVPDMSHVGNMVRGNLGAKVPAPQKATDFLGALEAGLQVSVSGLLARNKAPSVQADPDAPWYNRAAGGVAQMVGDVPFMIGGALLGAGAGIPTGPGAAITGTAGAFALPASLRATLMDGYTKGDFHSFGDFWDRASGILWETTKAWMTGAATGGAGVAAKAVLPVVAPMAAKIAAPTAAELTAMVTVGSALEGHAPAAQDFVDAAIVLGGAKAATKLAPKLREIYSATGKTPAEVVADAKADPTIAADLAAGSTQAAPKAAGEGVAGADALPSAYKPLAAAERARAIVPGIKAAEVAQSPFADLPQVAGEPAKPTHVNYNLLNTSEDAAGALARLSSIYEQEIQTQRRGTVGWEQTSAEAARMLSDTLGGVDATLLMPRAPGTPAGAAEILARKQLTIGAAEDMARQAREYQAKGTAVSPEDTVSFLASIERAAMIQQEFLGARAEAGRALNILKSTARDAERVRQIQDVMKMYGGDPATLAKMIGDMDTASGALKFAKDALKATTWEKIIEVWKAGLLSGPVTHIANIMGNGIFLAMRAPIDLVASGIGVLRTGGDSVTAAEPLARIVGAMQGAQDGLKVAGAMLKDWRGEQDAGKAEQYRKAISGLKGDIIRLPYRFLSAEDAVFNTMNARGEAYTLAVRQAANEGLSPLTREFRERVASIVQNQSPEMVDAVAKAAERFTFNTPLGEMGQSVQSFVKTWHLEWAVPFIRTPANIAKELARLTPLAPALSEWRDDFKAGGAARDKAMAELATGTAAMSGVFMWALAGNVTGAGEPDAGKKRVQQAAGWQPYSVKIGDAYYAYNRLQPIGTLMGLAADAAEMWDHVTDDEADVIPKMLAVAFANAVTNQTFLQGITNVVNALSDPKRFGPSFLQGLARSAVPNIVGSLTEMNDPIARQVDGMLDAIKSRLPGFRETLLPKRDVFGEQIAGKERLGGLSPVTVTKDTEDKVRSEAARLNLSLGDAPKKSHVGRGSGKLGDVPLEPAQRDVFADVSGHLAHDVLTEIVNSSGWDALPDIVKKKAYAKVFLQAHRAGAAAALPPELRAGIAQEITQKIEAQLAPETTE